MTIQNMEGMEALLYTQGLAHTDNTIRLRTLNRLKKFLRFKSAKGGLNYDEMNKIWKGLYYCMYNADKPLVQEKLADEISGLIHLLSGNDKKILFFKAALISFQREWNGIDHFRMDKYFMLFARTLRQCFFFLSKLDWPENELKSISSLLETCVLDPTDKINAKPLGLKLHLIDICLEELVKVGRSSLPSNVIVVLLFPFVKTLALTNEARMIRAIRNNVLDTLFKMSEMGIEHDEDLALGEVKEKKKKKRNREHEEDQKENEQDEHEEQEENDAEEIVLDPRAGGVDVFLPPLKPDFKAIADLLVSVGALPEINSKKRKLIYSYVRKFEGLAAGAYPFPEVKSEAKKPFKALVKQEMKALIRDAQEAKINEDKDGEADDEEEDEELQESESVQVCLTKKQRKKKKKTKSSKKCQKSEIVAEIKAKKQSEKNLMQKLADISDKVADFNPDIAKESNKVKKSWTISAVEQLSTEVSDSDKNDEDIKRKRKNRKKNVKKDNNFISNPIDTKPKLRVDSNLDKKKLTTKAPLALHKDQMPKLIVESSSSNSNERLGFLSEKPKQNFSEKPTPKKKIKQLNGKKDRVVKVGDKWEIIKIVPKSIESNKIIKGKQKKVKRLGKTGENKITTSAIINSLSANGLELNTETIQMTKNTKKRKRMQVKGHIENNQPLSPTPSIVIEGENLPSKSEIKNKRKKMKQDKGIKKKPKISPPENAKDSSPLQANMKQKQQKLSTPWDEPLQDGEVEIFVPSKKMAKKLVPQDKLVIMKTPKKNTRGRTLKINLAKNQEHDLLHYSQRLRSSPAIPYSANRKPSFSVLKPSPSPIPVRKSFKSQTLKSMQLKYNL